MTELQAFRSGIRDWRIKASYTIPLANGMAAYLDYSRMGDDWPIYASLSVLAGLGAMTMQYVRGRIATEDPRFAD